MTRPTREPEPRRPGRPARLQVGTSGWVYKQWGGTFYPPGLPQRRQLSFYAEHFSTVEINATFYRLPTLKMVEGWEREAPPGFLFAIKGSRFITHMKKLNIDPESYARFFERLAPLRRRRGPILWQLPPQLRSDPARLDRFLGGLPPGDRHAVEFRHPSWLNGQTYRVLRRHRAACVWISSQAMPPEAVLTTNFAYLRFHGLEGGAAHDYTRAEMEPWARLCRQALRRGRVFVYFNNDLNTRAPGNALLFRQMVLHPEEAL